MTKTEKPIHDIRNYSQLPEELPGWLKESDKLEWLAREYELLSSHYFHEDNSYWKVFSMLGALNIGLLAFYGSDFASQASIIQAGIPIVGIAFCLSWIISLVRLREYREYISGRIRQIEAALHRSWNSEGFEPLDIKTLRQWKDDLPESRWYHFPMLLARKVPSSLALMLAPISITVVWVLLLIVPLLSDLRPS